MIKEHITDVVHHAIKIAIIFFYGCNNTTHLSYFIAAKPSQKKTSMRVLQNLFFGKFVLQNQL
jgi:hypothetical protein